MNKKHGVQAFGLVTLSTNHTFGEGQQAESLNSIVLLKKNFIIRSRSRRERRPETMKGSLGTDR